MHLSSLDIVDGCTCAVPIDSGGRLTNVTSCDHHRHPNIICIDHLTCHTNTLNHGTHVKTPNLSHNSTKLNTLGDYRHLINIHKCTVSH